jgi:hypothetical protein
MAIFPRRVIQRMIDENRRFLSEKVVREQIRKLNKGNVHSLATEWEVLLLNILSKIGEIKHEVTFQGSKKPDVYFKSQRICPFVADIVAVSDRYSDEKNPREYFYNCIRDYFGKCSLSLGGVHIQLTGQLVGNYGDQKVKLDLPERTRIPAFVEKYFATIVKDIESDPQKLFSTVVGDENTKIKVSYKPGRYTSIGGGLLHTVPYSLRRNPVSKTLKDKAKDLEKTGFEGPAGVFLCDSDCYGLHMHSRSGGGFVLEDIIAEAFRRYTTLSFIVVLSIEEEHHTSSLKAKRYVKAACYLNTIAKFPVDETFRTELGAMCRFFPVPSATPVNALQMIKLTNHKGYSFIGGGSMCADEITIPSRTLTEIMAGTLKYNAAIKGKKGPLGSIAWMKDFFRKQVLAGKTIAEISVVNCPDEDDDWIKIRYGPSDPAISKFK